MKIFFLLSILSLTAQFSFSQNNVTLYGTITDPKGDYAYVKYYRDFISYDEVTVDSAKLDKKGNYSMNFSWPVPGAATFYHGDEITQMFLTPGDSLSLSLDTKEFDETIVYRGRGSRINSCLSAKALKFGYLGATEYKMKESEFTPMLDSIHEAEESFLSNYFKGSGHLEEIRVFLLTELADILYGWANYKTSYPGLNQYLNKSTFPPVLPDDYYDFMKVIRIYNPDAIHSSSYLEFLGDYVDRESWKLVAADSVQTFRQHKEQFIDRNVPGVLKEYILAHWTYETLTQENDLEFGTYLLNKIKRESPRNSYMELLERTVRIASTLSPGHPAPNFTLPDAKGKMVSLSDFRGKVVYLDIWATWCGPCRAEIPHALKLEEEMRNRDVVFLSVSVDEDDKAWKKMIKEKEMKGVHLISKGNFESTVAKLYNVKGIPQYVIIDQKGNIVTNNAERPSGKAKESLEALLE